MTHVRQRKVVQISLIFIAGIFILSLFFLIPSLSSCNTYRCLDFPGISSWKEKTVYEDSKNAWRGLLSSSDYLIKLEVDSYIPPVQAALFTKTKLMDIEGVFADARSPYPGAISDKITCEDKYKPAVKQIVSKAGVQVSYFKEYLNDRFQYGVCVDDQITYKAYTGIFYCGDVKKWYQMELIVNKDDKKPDWSYMSLFSNIGCQRPSVNTGKLLP